MQINSINNSPNFGALKFDYNAASLYVPENLSIKQMKKIALITHKQQGNPNDIIVRMSEEPLKNGKFEVSAKVAYKTFTSSAKKEKLCGSRLSSIIEKAAKYADKLLKRQTELSIDRAEDFSKYIYQTVV